MIVYQGGETYLRIKHWWWALLCGQCGQSIGLDNIISNYVPILLNYESIIVQHQLGKQMLSLKAVIIVHGSSKVEGDRWLTLNRHIPFRLQVLKLILSLFPMSPFPILKIQFLSVSIKMGEGKCQSFLPHLSEDFKELLRWLKVWIQEEKWDKSALWWGHGFPTNSEKLYHCKKTHYLFCNLHYISVFLIWYLIDCCGGHDKAENVKDSISWLRCYWPNILATMYTYFGCFYCFFNCFKMFIKLQYIYWIVSLLEPLIEMDG